MQRTVPTMDLSTLVRRARPFETSAAPVNPRTRAGAWTAMATTALASPLCWVIHSTRLAAAPRPGFFLMDSPWIRALDDAPRPGFFLVGWPWIRGLATFGGHAGLVAVVLLAALVLDVVVAVETRGFRAGSLPMQLATFAVVVVAVCVIVPFVLSAVIAALNLGIWLAFAVALLGLAIYIISIPVGWIFCIVAGNR